MYDATVEQPNNNYYGKPSVVTLSPSTGIVFEDSDELFDIEEYDAAMGCCPKGSGSGYLGEYQQRRRVNHLQPQQHFC